MPLYEYKCCNQIWEAIHTINRRNEEICDICGKHAKLIISVPAKPVVYEYYSENLGERITGPKQKAQVMKDKNVSEVA